MLLDNRIPFIKYFPIAFVKSISYFSYCAMICRIRTTGFHHLIIRSVIAVLAGSDKSDYEHRVAPDVAMIGNRDNDTPVQPQSERDKRYSGVKPSQAMGAVA